MYMYMNVFRVTIVHRYSVTVVLLNDGIGMQAVASSNV